MIKAFEIEKRRKDTVMEKKQFLFFSVLKLP
jgi:hypothetical protein